MSLEVKGVIPPIVTPYTDQQFDESKLRRFIDYVINGRVHGVFPLGTNGEGPLLTTEEKKKVIKTTVDHVDNRVPVIAGTSSPSTAETIELSRHAETVGADAVCVVNPYYYPTSADGLIVHYTEIAKAIKIPVIVYYIPSKTGNEIDVATMTRIAEIPNIVGMKDSSKDVAWFYQLKRNLEEKDIDFSLLGGGDALIYTHLSLGGKGSVSAVADVFPEIVVNLFDEFQSENYKRAKDIQHKVLRIRTILKGGPYMSGVKAALQILGLDVGKTRSPLVTMSSSQKKEMEERFRDAGLLEKYRVN